MPISRSIAAVHALSAALLLSCDAGENRGGEGPDGSPPADAGSGDRGATDVAATDGDRSDASQPPSDGSSLDVSNPDQRDALDETSAGRDGRGDERGRDDVTSGAEAGDASNVSDANGEGDSDASGEGGTCMGEVIDPPAAPMNLLILFDQSSSMSEYLDGVAPPTRWQAVTSTVIEFLQMSEARPHGVGIQWFELIDPATSMTSCVAAQYAAPEVEIAPLSDVAQFPALKGSIQSHMPTGFTPTSAALQGALEHAKQYALAHTDRPTIVVLLTDGLPTQCMPFGAMDIGTTIAAPAFTGMPSIRTSVVGVATGLGALSPIGTLGGGGTQFVTSAAATAADTKQALLRIARSHLTCSIALPTTDAGTAVDPAFVNIAVTLPGAPRQMLPLFSTPGGCGATDGWYYDNPTAPTRIGLCPATCNNVVVNSSVQIVVGCPGPPPT